ncbi:aminotransferase class IV [Microbulbifer halophilus]|uniref:Aminotransferase class IV n=1 Tax=Microbulbifer halophilus TaxID=453963 RepID=A0ABW5ED97_9GAMM|nr:aminotransferase class IV [Microbulbifer halophilus]MCW8127179.1 aminotransferase class IV [Microbulbifer halophilus]
MSKLPLYLQDGVATEALPPDPSIDDGLLETMRCQNGAIPLWPLHRARLARSGVLTAGELDAIEQPLQRFVVTCPPGAARARLRIGRLAGRRYWDLTLAELGQAPGLQRGVRLFPCDERLPVGKSANPGCKFLQRARYNRAGEELPADADDGLMRDSEDRAIESLRCNLLVRLDGRWLTPLLDRCGVRGVMRDWLGRRIPLEEVDIPLERLLGAEELALCNSVRGVLPVRELIDHRDWTPGEETRRLQRLIAEELW